jgi:hypothetical protein
MAEPAERAGRAYKTYMNAGRNSIYRALSAVGPENLLRVVLDNAESNRISDIQSLQRIVNLKKGAGGSDISSPELATALTLVNRDVAAYWECIRLFPSEFYSHGRTMLLDFMTNVVMNGKNLAVEYHSFSVKLAGVENKFRGETLGRDLEKRKAAYKDSGLIVVLASDINPEKLQNATGIDVMSFCDYYISARDRSVTDNSGTTHMHANAPRIERKAFETSFFEVFKRNPSESSVRLGTYHALLSHVLLSITQNTAAVRLKDKDFSEALGSYLRLKVWPRIMEGPPAPPEPARW